VSALVKGPQCLQSTGNTSLEPFDDTRSHVTVTRYILPHSVTLSRLARLSIPGRLAEVSLHLNLSRRSQGAQICAEFQGIVPTKVKIEQPK
jgi:hypothetical protein